MKCAGVGGFSAVVRAATRADPGVRVGVKRRVLLELQWQGRGGRFRHLALSPPDVLRALGTFGLVASLALIVVGAYSVRSSRALAPSRVDTVLREHAELKAQRDALRERAYDLAEQLYWRVEQGRRMVRMADSPGQAWKGQCPRPPARGAGDAAVLDWLSEQGTRLEAIGDELAAGRVEMGVQRASALAPPHAGRPAVRGEPALYVADMGPARRRGAAPAKR